MRLDPSKPRRPYGPLFGDVISRTTKGVAIVLYGLGRRTPYTTARPLSCDMTHKRSQGPTKCRGYTRRCLDLQFDNRLEDLKRPQRLTRPAHEVCLQAVVSQPCRPPDMQAVSSKSPSATFTSCQASQVAFLTDSSHV